MQFIVRVCSWDNVQLYFFTYEIIEKSFYTMSHKKGDTKLLAVTLSNLMDFKKSFNRIL